MRARWYLVLAAAALLPVAAWAQVPPAPTPFGGGNASAAVVTATGATAARTLAARAADVVNVKDYGAVCNDSMDDTRAINAAIAAARSAGAAHLVFPSGATCMHAGTLNFTSWQAKGAVIDGAGVTLDCEVSSAPCIDALNTRFLHWRDLTVSALGAVAPTIGLQIGVTGAGVADSHTFTNVFVHGTFSLTAVYNRGTETTLWDHLFAWNSYSGGTAYDLILDGYNHFAVTSAFLTVTTPTDTAISFQENTFVTPDFRRTGPGAAVWSGSTMRHRYIGGYVGNTGTSGVTSYGFVLYGSNTLPEIDVHFEAYPYLTDAIYVTAPSGTTSETLNGLRVRDNEFEGTNSILKVDTALSGGVTLTNADIEIGGLMYASKIFDSPTPWAISGSYKLPSGSSAWNLTAGQFSGVGMVGAAASFYGNGNNIALPSTLNVSSIGSTGGVASLTITHHGGYEFVNGATLGQFPQPTIAAPPSGGQQAHGQTTTMIYEGSTSAYLSGDSYVPATAGAGCSVNDFLTLSGGTYTSQVIFKVTSVNGRGGVLTMGNNGQGSYTALPAEGSTLTGGTCTNAPTLAGMLWAPGTLAIVAPGAGYTTAPVVRFPTGTTSTSTATATLGATMTLQVANAGIALSSVGTQLGVAGSGGTPVLSAGALIDNSGVRQSLGSSYTVPANTSLVRFTQSSAVSASMVTLPTALGDGQPVQFVNYAGAITALSFSPAVNGWSNGSMLPAYTGLRVRWDATAGAWYREQ